MGGVALKRGCAAQGPGSTKPYVGREHQPLKLKPQTPTPETVEP